MYSMPSFMNCRFCGLSTLRYVSQECIVPSARMEPSASLVAVAPFPWGSTCIAKTITAIAVVRHVSFT